VTNGVDVEFYGGNALPGKYGPRRLTTWILYGTKPHPINPIPPNEWLHFFWEKKGEWVFFKHVNHPGQKPNKFNERVITANRVELRQRLKQELHNALLTVRTSVSG